MERMVPVCDKRYHIYNIFRHFGAEIKNLWNYPLACIKKKGGQISTANTFPKTILAVNGKPNIKATMLPVI